MIVKRDIFLILSFILNTKDLGISGAITTTLFNKGHYLYIRKRYSSHNLFKFLHLNKTNACSTMRANKLGMPEFQKMLGIGQKEVCRHKKWWWIDKRQALMITSENNDEIIWTGKYYYKTKDPIMEPKCVHKNNCNIWAVYRTDIMIVNVENISILRGGTRNFFLFLFCGSLSIECLCFITT